MIKDSKKTQGFGLIEVLIASTIIIMTISSLTFVARGALTSTDRTQDRIQAVNLAAEGIEIVRNIRDTNWIDRRPETDWGNWVGSTFNGVVAGGVYKINYSAGSLNRFNLISVPIGAPAENITLLNGAVFTRTIQVDSIVNATSGLMPGSNQSNLQGQAYKVTVKVTTPSKAEINVSEILTNWRPNF
ncbi:MAG TPA: hypothetical protein VJK08_02945 [Patescibacteria group bacterium]|nr:hypothetical protein [Patescibacteria group bacterium]